MRLPHVTWHFLSNISNPVFCFGVSSSRQILKENAENLGGRGGGGGVLCVHTHICVHQDSYRVGELDIRMVEGMGYIHPREGSRWISSPTSHTKKVVVKEIEVCFSKGSMVKSCRHKLLQRKFCLDKGKHSL